MDTKKNEAFASFFFGVPDRSLLSSIEGSPGAFSQSPFADGKGDWSSFLLPSEGKNKNASKEALLFLVCLTGVEPAAFRVGV